jgi:hypothetical protein
MTDAFNDYVRRETNRSLGTLMAENAGKGRLNSSITSKGINEISTSTADALAKNYMQMLGQASQNYGTLLGGASDDRQGLRYLNNNMRAFTTGRSVGI